MMGGADRRSARAFLSPGKAGRPLINRSQTAVADILSGIPLFSGLKPALLAQVAKASTVDRGSAGTIFYKRGALHTGLHCVVSGSVKLALPVSACDEKVVALIRPGGTFGEAEMFLDAPAMVSAEAIRPAVIVSIARSGIDAALRRDAVFGSRLVAEVSRHWQQMLGSLESYAVHSGRQRVADFLLGELPRPDAADTTIVLPAKKRDIASHLNLTHEHFSRILHELAAEGHISVHGAAIAVHDSTTLRSLL